MTQTQGRKKRRSPGKPAASARQTHVIIGPVFGLEVIRLGKGVSPVTAEQTAGEVAEMVAPEAPPAPPAPIKEAAAPPAPPWDPASFDVPPVADRVRFHDFDLPDPLMHGICDLSFRYCTPIQAAILQHTLSGGDATGRAQTGTGKTAAFLITAITRLLKNPPDHSLKRATPRALVIAPTRELVLQIADDCEALCRHTGLTVAPIYGGMDYQKQLASIANRTVDIVVATPGRLLDFQRKQEIHLNKVEIFVIDEADRMLDMGFIPDVRHIVYSLPPKGKRQTLLFSATLTPEVHHLSAQWTKDPVIVEIEPEQVTVDTVEEIVYMVSAADRYALLYNIITRQHVDRAIIFGNRRDETRKLTDILSLCKIKCDLLSGDVAQKKRMQTLEDFKSGRIQILVATDVAGRGIHVEGVSHVFNFTLPYDPEDYVHRIGRTGRAGKTGISISFASEEDAFYIPDIEAYIGHKLECRLPEEEWLKLPESIDPEKLKASSRRPAGARGGRPPRSGGRGGKGGPRRKQG
ncbi:MAG: DEAD/DEAH box helicase [Thermodesulfobacteriota bacterium]